MEAVMRRAKGVQSSRFESRCSLPAKEWQWSQVSYSQSFQSTRRHRAIFLDQYFFQDCQNQRVTPICSSPSALKQPPPYTRKAAQLRLQLCFTSRTYTCTGSATLSNQSLRSLRTRVYLCLSLNISAHSLQNLFFTNQINACSLASLGMQASRSHPSSSQMFMLVQTTPRIGLLCTSNISPFSAQNFLISELRTMVPSYRLQAVKNGCGQRKAWEQKSMKSNRCLELLKEKVRWKGCNFVDLKILTLGP